MSVTTHKPLRLWIGDEVYVCYRFGSKSIEERHRVAGLGYDPFHGPTVKVDGDWFSERTALSINDLGHVWLEADVTMWDRIRRRVRHLWLWANG